MFGPQLLLLFGDLREPLGGGTCWRKHISGWALRLYSLIPLPVCSLLASQAIALAPKSGTGKIKGASVKRREGSPSSVLEAGHLGSKSWLDASQQCVIEQVA